MKFYVLMGQYKNQSEPAAFEICTEHQYDAGASERLWDRLEELEDDPEILSARIFTFELGIDADGVRDQLMYPQSLGNADLTSVGVSVKLDPETASAISSYMERGFPVGFSSHASIGYIVEDTVMAPDAPTRTTSVDAIEENKKADD